MLRNRQLMEYFMEMCGKEKNDSNNNTKKAKKF